jgi:hypothetical protein
MKTLILVLSILLWSHNAEANMANPWWQGDPATEPMGGFKQLAVTRAQLHFDLRPLAQPHLAQTPYGQPEQTNTTAQSEAQAKVKVSAIYHIENKGKDTSIELFFVSPAIERGTVTLNGKPITARVAPARVFPSSWQFPKQIKGFDGNPISVRTKLSPEGTKGLLFRADLASGQHEIKVDYALRPGIYHPSNHTYRQYEIAYLLAPARLWSEFGNIEFVVQLPTDWQIASSLPLTRTEHTMSGNFAQIPADTLVIYAQQRSVKFMNQPWMPISALILGLLLCAAYFWHRARRNPRSVESNANNALKQIWALVWRLCVATILVSALTFCAALLQERLLDSTQISQNWSYVFSITSFLLLVASLLGTFVFGLLAHLLGRWMFVKRG